MADIPYFLNIDLQSFWYKEEYYHLTWNILMRQSGLSNTYFLVIKRTFSKKMILIIFSGAASLNAKMNGMIALRTIVYFLVTSLISALLGLAMVLIIHPGNPETKNLLGDGNTAERKVDIVDNFLDLGRNLFPDNLFQASFQTVSTYIIFSVKSIWRKFLWNWFHEKTTVLKFLPNLMRIFWFFSIQLY